MSEKCVACGEPMERVTPLGEYDHHCSERFERQREGIHKRREHVHIHTPTFAERLSYGFSLLQFG